MASKIVRLGDDEMKFDIDAIDVRAALVIKAHTGYGLLPWARACAELEPAALQAAAWLLFHQNGEDREIAGLNFDVQAMYLALFGKE